MDQVTSLNTTREMVNTWQQTFISGTTPTCLNSAPIPQPRINFGMILPMKFGLEQFLEMTKALKHIEDKYSKPPYNRCELSTQGNNSNKENQQPNGLMQLTSQTSQHGQITQNMQIGNVSVEQMATSMGSNLDHLVEALEEVFCPCWSTEEQDTQEKETALTSTIL